MINFLNPYEVIVIYKSWTQQSESGAFLRTFFSKVPRSVSVKLRSTHYALGTFLISNLRTDPGPRNFPR